MRVFTLMVVLSFQELGKQVDRIGFCEFQARAPVHVILVSSQMKDLAH